jgi:carotenoid 1,2-hydratase
VPSGGYAWWYIDGLSDDGLLGVTVIAFLGSAFSPYYAFRRRRGTGRANPYDHVAINVAVYGADGYRWSMTERGEHALLRRDDTLAIGPSRLAWSSDGSLVVDLDEISVPIPRRIRGRLRIRPEVRGERAFQIDPSGRHVWQPIAPRARIDVEWASPSRAWSGSAYIDHNRGDEPLEAAFRGWSWSRSIESKRTRIFYDITPKSGPSRSLVLEYGSSGEPREIDAPPLASYGRSLWQLPLAARSDSGTRPHMLESWEDGPFYARALIDHVISADRTRSVHETLSLERLARPLVQAMLPFRMPRRR